MIITELFNLTAIKEYFGVEIEMPIWARWASVTKVGELVVFDDKPELDEETWFSITGRCQVIGLVDLGEVDWKRTIQPLEHHEPRSGIRTTKKQEIIL